MGSSAYAPKHPDLIFDVGMHRGEDAEFYLRKGFRVVAFEANPELIAACREKFKDYLKNGKLTIVEGAIVDPASVKAGQRKIRFYQNSALSVWGTVNAEWAERNSRLGKSSTVIEVEAIDFADAIMEYGVPYFMKIDIEGCDTLCLTALLGFEEKPTYISIESDKTSFGNVRREIELFMKLGYTSFQAVEQSVVPQTRSLPNPPREGKYAAAQFEEGASGPFGLELDGEWKSEREILRHYRWICLGYRLVGDDGIMSGWKFRGARRIRLLTERFIGHFTHGAVPGWYDTHARHSGASAENATLSGRGSD